MANDREEKPGVNESVPPAGTQIKIKWDDSNVRSAYSNVCNVSGTREEFVLSFGMNQSWHPGQKELTVQLTERIVMNPFAAKRLAILLNNVIRNYESQYGALDIEPRRPADTSG